MDLPIKDFPTDSHGWGELLSERNVSSDFSGRLRVPWAIVGAGFTGLACARRLAELHPDDEIALIDARLIGQGASGRNSGFAVAVSHFPGRYIPERKRNFDRVNRINQAGVEILDRLIKTLAIDCQWDKGGFYHAAADADSLNECDNFLEYLNAMEIAHTSLNKDEMASRLGTALYKAGVHVHEGALVQPAALVQGLASKLPSNITLIEQNPVLKVEERSSIKLFLSSGEIITDRLMLATNYEASKLGFLSRRLIGSTLSGSFTRKLNEGELATLGTLREWGLLSLHGGGATVRLTSDGRISLRNTAEFNGGRLLSEKKLKNHQAIHRVSFERRFPQLMDVPFEYAWSGVEGISRNSTNFFGKQTANVYYAGGYNGSGVSKGSAFGYALAEYASGGQSSLVTDCLESAPAKWIPPRPFLDVGATFAVRSRFRGVGLDR